MSVKDAINQAITLLDRITVEADEDSALGMAFVSGRISEDGFYITKNDLERSLKELEQQLAAAHRSGWEQAKESSQLTIQQLEAMNKALMEQLARGVSMQPAPIMIANTDAHRLGWEQAKKDAKNIAHASWGDGASIGYEIAAMEYGGKAND